MPPNGQSIMTMSVCSHAATKITYIYVVFRFLKNFCPHVFASLPAALQPWQIGLTTVNLVDKSSM